MGDKWTLLIIRDLAAGPRRFVELQRVLPGISTEQLRSRLNRMVADGLLTRQRYREVPPRVDYELTERSRELMPVLGALARWGYDWTWSAPRPGEDVNVGAIFARRARLPGLRPDDRRGRRRPPDAGPCVAVRRRVAAAATPTAPLSGAACLGARPSGGPRRDSIRGAPAPRADAPMRRVTGQPRSALGRATPRRPERLDATRASTISAATARLADGRCSTALGVRTAHVPAVRAACAASRGAAHGSTSSAAIEHARGGTRTHTPREDSRVLSRRVYQIPPPGPGGS